MMPTFCDLVGITIPSNTDGISIVPTLMGKKSQKTHNYLYWEFPAYKGQQAVRMGKWKAIRRNIYEGNLAIELYDLESDIQELKNVADQHMDIVKKITVILDEAHTPSHLERFQFPQLGD